MRHVAHLPHRWAFPGVALVLLALVAPLGAQRPAARPQAIDEAYTAKIKEYTQDPRVITELVDHVPASATGAVAAEVPRPHPGHARRADVLQGHLPLLRRARQGLGPRQGVPHRQDRRRPRHDHRGDRRRGHDQVSSTRYKGITAQLDRPAQADRGGGAAAHRDGQADLLRHRRHPLARDGQPRDADGAGATGSPSRRRRSSSRSATTSSWRSRRSSRWTAATSRWTPGTSAKRTGQTLPLMYWGKYVAHDNNRDGMGQALEAHAEPDGGVPRLAPDGVPRPARVGAVPLHLDRHRALQRCRSTRSSPTSGGCWRSTKSAR